MEIFEKIQKEKDIVLIKKIEDLHIYEDHHDADYKDIIGFFIAKESLKNWKEIERKFIPEIEDILVNSENEAAIEPYLIFFINRDEYYNNMEQIVKIEKDEFYCRKFVFPIDNNQILISKLPFGNPIELQIKRDNFLPAEKTLMRLGVNKENAARLSHSTQMLEDEKDKIIQYFENFNIITNDVDLIIKNQEIENSVRLKQMDIEGFRIYGRKQQFDLDADLVVLYGSNGLGKTSFFDAFEYGVTGEIKRFSNKDDKANKNIVKNFGIDIDEKCKVKLKFDVLSNDGKKEFEAERILGEERVTLTREKSRKKEQTKTLINMITQKNITFKKEDLIRLFRATHINNQEDSELTENAIKGSSAISNEILGKMISFEDYTVVDNNIRKLIKKNLDQISALQKEKKDLEDELNDINIRYREQQSVLSEQQNSETLSKLKFQIKEELKESNIFSGDKFEKNFIEKEVISKIQDKMNNIEYNLKDINKVKKVKLEIKELNNKYNKNNLKLLKDKISEKQKELKTINSQIQEQGLKIQEYTSNLSDKEKLKIEIEIYVQNNIHQTEITKKITELNEEKEKIILEIQQLKDNLETRAKIQNSIIYANLDLDEKLSNIREKIGQVEEVYRNYEGYINFKVKLEAIIKDTENFNLKKKEVIEERDLIACDIKGYSNLIYDLELEIKQETEKNNEFEKVLLSLKPYVNSNHCPVCSAVHESKETLIKIIDEKMSNISENLVEKKSNLLKLKELREEKNIYLANLQIQIVELEEKINVLISDKEKINILIEKFNINIKKLSLSDDKIIIKKTLDELNKEQSFVHGEFIKNNIQRKMSEKEIEEMQNGVNKKTEYLEQVSKNILIQSEQFTILNKKNLELMNYQILKSIDFNNKGKQLALLEKLDSEIYKLNNKLKEDKVNLTKLKKNKTDNSNEISELTNQVMDFNKIEENIIELQSQVNLLNYNNLDLDDFDKETKLLSINLSRLELLKSKIFRVLNLMEFEILSINQKELSSNMQSIRRKIQEYEISISKYQSININISNIQKELKNIQNDIVENYCKRIEPLVSIIQGRLRTLYGFTDLNLILDKVENEVKIVNSHYALHNSSQLKPYKYLSEAQKNIIRLSLFLSTTLSQKWSGFQTIFLDDPVQHFDDLNVYAFLELLKSLILSKNEKNRKQIIISTCDSKFFSLIREKFNILKKKGRVKYYIFESINEQGPVIVEDDKSVTY